MVFRTSTHDNLHDTMDIGENIIIPKSQYAEALFLEPGIAPVVLVSVECMLPAVELDNDPFLKADEVHDIKTDRLLAFEFQAVHSFCAEVSPQEAFSVGGSSSQIPGALEINISHTPLPVPPLQGGRGPDCRLGRDI